MFCVCNKCTIFLLVFAELTCSWFKPSFNVLKTSKVHFGYSGCIFDSLLLFLKVFLFLSFSPLPWAHVPQKQPLCSRLMLWDKHVCGVWMCPLYFESAAVTLAVSVPQETEHWFIHTEIWWLKISPVQLQLNFTQNPAVCSVVLLMHIETATRLRKVRGFTFHLGASEITLMEGIKLYDLMSICKQEIFFLKKPANNNHIEGKQKKITSSKKLVSLMK